MGLLHMWRRYVTGTGTLLCILVGAGAMCAREPAGDSSSASFRNISPDVGYVGSEVCSGCHSAIYASFIKTDMGRSMSRLGAGEQPVNIPARLTVRDASHNRYYEVFRQGADYFQSEYELAPNGTEVFRNTQKLVYAIGASANGVGYIVRRGSFLLEAPLSYYSKSKTWALSPGYELGDYGFGRTVAAGCIVCHSGRPALQPDEYGRYDDPPFHELAIGCENCHGPGELHVRERAQNIAPSGSWDSSIVNPAKLTGWLADNICMNCHQAGDAGVLQPGKRYSDFRPGTPLDQTVALFALPLKTQPPSASPLLEHFSLMKLSKCFTASGGRMSCLTCHDPHVQPRSRAAAYYRERCLTCHTETSCPVPVSVRTRGTPPDDCAGCHMPRRKLTLISHSVLTDHRIVRDINEPYPEAAFHQTTPESPYLLHINAIPGAQDNIPPVTLLHAYGELLGPNPELREPFLDLVKQLGTPDSRDPWVLSALAQRSMGLGTTEGKEEAAHYWTLAIEQGSSLVADYENLGTVLGDLGRTQEAITILTLGIKLDPYNDRLYKRLAQLDIANHRYTDALAVMKEDVELFPQDDFMRSLLRKAEIADSTNTRKR